MLVEKMIINIVLMPLLGSFLAYFAGKKYGDRPAVVISSVFLIAAAFFSYLVAYDVIFEKNVYEINLFDFVSIRSLNGNWGLFVDAVTAVMLIVVTTVSAIVHLYSIGYMEEDPCIPRFMSYLSLFTFFMLMLVTSNNILQLFFGWEGVGLCSYLLIGFWYEKPSANAAAIKAFIVNRVADLAFILGIASLFINFDSIYFKDIFLKVSSFKDNHVIDITCLLLFIGAMGKSAQIGLHTWLPDAMEGPTPVSALIHAATMVTAGVFLVIRMSPVFEISPDTLTFITYIGAITAFFAASIALVQNDIKKIIAYSTCSQLGYMFFACGVGAYPVALFHLMTHAFFKALLFLGAGNVIHATHHKQDIRNMGGLWKQIPITYSLMTIGSLALAGIYPFAGYFSKDLILEVAYAKANNSGFIAYVLGSIGALFTAFYSWRLIFKVFHGESHDAIHAHEAPKIMTIPLYVLAFGAIFSGILAVTSGILTPEFWSNSLVFGGIIEQAHHISGVLKLTPIILSFLGIGLAYIFYIKYKEMAEVISHALYGLYLLLLNKYYFDEVYNFIFVRPFAYLSNLLWKSVDIKIIDGCGPNGFADISQKMSAIISRVQSGYIYSYVLVMIASIIAILSWFLVI